MTALRVPTRMRCLASLALDDSGDIKRHFCHSSLLDTPGWKNLSRYGAERRFPAVPSLCLKTYFALPFQAAFAPAAARRNRLSPA